MKVDNEKINSLLESIRKNDLFALGELMEAITPKIAKIACAILKDPQLAEDVVDEVLIALVQNIHSFKSDKNMNGWLNAVTINKSSFFPATIFSPPFPPRSPRTNWRKSCKS